jgi:hypothetical protein
LLPYDLHIDLNTEQFLPRGVCDVTSIYVNGESEFVEEVPYHPMTTGRIDREYIRLIDHDSSSYIHTGYTYSLRRPRMSWVLSNARPCFLATPSVELLR